MKTSFGLLGCKSPLRIGQELSRGTSGDRDGYGSERQRKSGSLSQRCRRILCPLRLYEGGVVTTGQPGRRCTGTPGADGFANSCVLRDSTKDHKCTPGAGGALTCKKDGDNPYTCFVYLDYQWPADNSRGIVAPGTGTDQSFIKFVIASSQYKESDNKTFLQSQDEGTLTFRLQPRFHTTAKALSITDAATKIGKEQSVFEAFVQKWDLLTSSSGFGDSPNPKYGTQGYVWRSTPEPRLSRPGDLHKTK